ncbi:MAG: serine hydrolase domain-containing protein [Planctomycetota bacterium]
MTHAVSRRLISSIAVLATGIALVGCSSSRPPSFPAEASLEQKIEITREHLALPGAVVAVYRDGEPLIDRAFGIASLETGEPMTTDHHFRIASLTKPVIATVILQLVDEGHVSLDDPIGQYIDGVPGGDVITLRQLAQHTSGLRNYIAISDVKDAFANEPTRTWTEEELLDLAFEEGPYFKPGRDGWMYSNTNYILLGQMIERVESKPLAAVIEDRIARPLGLTGTFYSTDAAIPAPATTGYQYGDETGPKFWVGKGTIPYDVTDASPSMWHAAGAMVSTLDDVRTLLDAIVTGALISESSHREQMIWRDSGYPVDYSYGLGVINYMGAIGHNGHVPGYQVSAFHVPEEMLTVVVLANLYSSPNYEEPANAIMFVILRDLLDRSYAPPGWGGW